jgi:hypothetical protein
MAVDDQGNAIRLSNGVWSAPRSLQHTGLNSVSCTGPAFCAAVGVNGTAFVFRGARWSDAETIDPKSADQADSYGQSSLSTVSCATTTFCMAGDVLGRVSIFNGTRWTRPHPIEPAALYAQDRHHRRAAIVDISCPQPAFCVAITDYGRALLFDGSKWSSPHALASRQVVGLDELVDLPTLTAISCSGPDFCTAVDPNGNAFTFDGASWSHAQPVDTRHSRHGSGLSAISCPSPRSCVAVDDQGRALTLRNGSWGSAVPVDPSLGLISVSCSGAAFCVSLNDLGQASTYDGRTWSKPVDIEP